MANNLRFPSSCFSPASAVKADRFFGALRARGSHLAWMEDVFYRMADQVNAGNITVKKTPAHLISSVSPQDSRYFIEYSSLQFREQHYRDLGTQAIKDSKLIVVDLAAGMATGFGGTAKGAVEAVQDARFNGESGKLTFMDIKRTNYFLNQLASGGHLIAAAMVSDETESSIVANLEQFARGRNLNLVLINDGTCRREIEKIWREYRNRWQDTILVPIIRQPATLLISQDGQEVGDPYMKGHGDFYDMVKNQLRDILEVVGVKYLFVSNIDNTGGTVSRSILGLFIEQAQQQKINAIMEAAAKYDGDKGGVPALVNDKLALLEQPFVPPALLDDFLGTSVFPYFNTNTFWFTASVLMEQTFELPLMVTKVEKRKGTKWLKIESILGHGLDFVKWKALAIDRSLRFNPVKFLPDLWTIRSDWMRRHNGRLMPIMIDGNFLPRPLIGVSGSVFSNVEEFDRAIYAGGAGDSMRDLKTMLIGGEGGHFNYGRYSSQCAVRYRGDVAVIYGYTEGRTPGTLTVTGRGEYDEITLADCVIFVPPGEQLVINSSQKGFVDGRVDPRAFEKFLNIQGGWAADKWPQSQRDRLLAKFFSGDNISSSPYEVVGHREDKGGSELL